MTENAAPVSSINSLPVSNGGDDDKITTDATTDDIADTDAATIDAGMTVVAADAGVTEVDDDVHAAAGVTVVGGGNEATQKWSRGKTLKGASTLVGCLLVHLTLGAFYTYGGLRR